MNITSAQNSRWRIIACDLDGTLIGWDHKINDRDLDSLRRARAAGFHVALCTGRNTRECAGIISALGLDPPLGLGVFANGGLISDMDTGKSVYAQVLPDTLAEEIIDFLGSRGHAVLVLGDDVETRMPLYALTTHGPAHEATTDWLAVNRVYVEPLDVLPTPFYGRMVRLGCVVTVDEAPALHDEIIHHFGNRAASHSIYSPHYDCQIIEVFSLEVNKWTGLVHLSRLMNVHSDQVIAIGDDINDIAMLQNARLSFAMDSAMPGIKPHAKRITAAQKDCGVAVAVDLLLSGQLES